MESYEVEGKLDDDCRSVLLKYPTMLKRLLRKWVGKEILVTIQPLVEKQSDRQRRYMHGVIVPCIAAWFLETTGIKYSHDQVYTWCRVSLLEEEPVIELIAGKEVVVMTGKRFSAMGKREYAEKVDIIIAKMAEQGCHIPPPTKNNLITDYITDD